MTLFAAIVFVYLQKRIDKHLWLKKYKQKVQKKSFGMQQINYVVR